MSWQCHCIMDGIRVTHPTGTVCAGCGKNILEETTTVVQADMIFDSRNSIPATLNKIRYHCKNALSQNKDKVTFEIWEEFSKKLFQILRNSASEGKMSWNESSCTGFIDDMRFTFKVIPEPPDDGRWNLTRKFTKEEQDFLQRMFDRDSI